MSERIEVRRRVWAWDVQVRGDVDGSTLFEALGNAIGEHPIAGLTFIAGGLVLMFALPFLLLAVEVAALLTVTAVVVGSRVVLRRPWVVEARYRRNKAVIGRWDVQGFRRAGVARDQIRQLVADGQRPPVSGPYDPDNPPPPRPSLRRPTGDGVGAHQDPLDDPTWPTETE